MMQVCADPTVPPAVMAVEIREVSWNETGRFRLSPTLNCWLTGKPEVNFPIADKPRTSGVCGVCV